jgi:hypothetical protein
VNEPTAIAHKDKALRKTKTFQPVVRVLFEARSWLIWPLQYPLSLSVFLPLIPQCSFWHLGLLAPATTFCE